MSEFMNNEDYYEAEHQADQARQAASLEYWRRAYPGKTDEELQTIMDHVYNREK